MVSKKKHQPRLNARQLKYLKGLGHHLKAKLLIGRGGVTPAVISSLEEILSADELVKIKLQESCPVGRKEAGPLLAGRTGARLVQLIGRTLLLYRANRDLAADSAIVLPD